MIGSGDLHCAEIVALSLAVLPNHEDQQNGHCGLMLYLGNGLDPPKRTEGKRKPCGKRAAAAICTKLVYHRFDTSVSI